ncbi:MAG: NUDIX domain-containing protein [archaeon]|jgi:8-oxo-dGTP diphosphatase
MTTRSPAAKAFIVKNKKLLLVKRADDDVEHPSSWELPGGRIEVGEKLEDGLKREVKEETNLEIEILRPLCKRKFTRVDGQKIEMTSFVCTTKNDIVTLSKEHTEYKWLTLKEAEKIINSYFLDEIKEYQKSTNWFVIQKVIP